MSSRYEILPLGSVDAEVAAAPRPLAITVTCSPRHGLDRTVDVAARVAASGHQVVVHMAARTIRDADHLDAVLERLETSGIEDVFLVAGDGEPTGPYASAVELLPIIAAHDRRPRRIGIAAYPEGHPLIDAQTLAAALREKAPLADYMVNQLCFDPATLLRWLEDTRAAGVDLPVYLGIPGPVDRRRLFEMSMRVGVGTSISFLRKQRGIRHLLGRRDHAADHLYHALAPLVGDPELGVVGFHFFTFNRLGATIAWHATRSPQLSIATTKTGVSTT